MRDFHKDVRENFGINLPPISFNEMSKGIETLWKQATKINLNRAC